MEFQDVDQALTELEEQLNELAPAASLAATADKVVKLVQEIPAKQVVLLDTITQGAQNHQRVLSELFSEGVTALTVENRELQQITKEVQQAAQAEIEQLAVVRQDIQALGEKIRQVNFPERLDKLDASVTGIMTAVQAVQNRMETVDRNISDRIRDLQDYQKETRSAMLASLEQTKSNLQEAQQKATQQLKIQHYITWGLMLVVIILLFTFRAKYSSH